MLFLNDWITISYDVSGRFLAKFFLCYWQNNILWLELEILWFPSPPPPPPLFFQPNRCFRIKAEVVTWDSTSSETKRGSRCVESHLVSCWKCIQDSGQVADLSGKTDCFHIAYSNSSMLFIMGSMRCYQNLISFSFPGWSWFILIK